MKITRTSGAEESRPRKIADVGPVNFAERRERIQRAYTKSIHESEQKEIRARNLQRLKEREAREAAEKAERVAKEAAQTKAETPISTESPPEQRTSPSKPPKPLHISTNFTRGERPVENGGHNVAIDVDSPTLGIPGSFVDDLETPASAMSNVTGITEIDNEQQTEAPRQSRPMSSQFIEWNQLSPEQANYGLDHSVNGEQGTIQMMLDASPAEEHPQESTPTNDQFARDPSPPGAFKRDSEYDKPIFATTVTTASPKETTPEQSRPVTPLESGDEAGLTNGDLAHDAHEAGNSQIHPPSEILFHPQYEQSSTPESSNASRNKTDSVLAPPPSIMNNVHDYLNTPVSEFGYESSDGYGAPNASDHEYDPYGPDSHSHVYRASHQSNWTDYSVETTDACTTPQSSFTTTST
jgi:hypothetical protein